MYCKTGCGVASSMRRCCHMYTTPRCTLGVPMPTTPSFAIDWTVSTDVPSSAWSRASPSFLHWGALDGCQKTLELFDLTHPSRLGSSRFEPPSDDDESKERCKVSTKPNNRLAVRMRGAAPGGQASSSGLVNCPRHDLCSGKTCQLAVSSSSSRLSTPPSGPHPPAPQHSTLTTVAPAAASRDRDSAGHGCGAASGLSNTERFAAIKASRTALLNTLASLKKRHRHSIVRARAAAAAAPAAADRRTGRERGRAATSAAGRKGGGAGGSIGTRIGYSPPSTVVFKDENSSVIAEVPAAVAARLDADITHVVTRLVADPAFAADRHANLEKAFVLQDRMRKGLQRISDFADLGALFGYARRKFRSRAITAYALLRSACDALPPELAVLLTEPAGRVTTVVSIGGGPGNDIFGYVLFVRHGAFVRGGGTDDATAAAGTVDGDVQADLNVVDFAPGWGTIVFRVAELTGQPIRFRGCESVLAVSPAGHPWGWMVRELCGRSARALWMGLLTPGVNQTVLLIRIRHWLAVYAGPGQVTSKSRSRQTPTLRSGISASAAVLTSWCTCSATCSTRSWGRPAIPVVSASSTTSGSARQLPGTPRSFSFGNRISGR